MKKSMLAQRNKLSQSANQRVILEDDHLTLPRFEQVMQENGLAALRPLELGILQINVGKMCNQTCTHCHVDAGPDRREIMTRETMEECLSVIRHTPSIHTVDLTGGAPEMNPDFVWFVEQVSALGRKTIVRSNLTILVSNKKYENYPTFFAEHGITVIASMPCYTEENVDKQRGNGVYVQSIEALKRLNAVGYGQEGSGLELNLVYNPGGPSLPGPQDGLERDYKKILHEQHGITFNHLFTITNLPISRFLDSLMISGRYEEYMEKLVHAFNPSAAAGVMCTNTLSVGWDGQLYDCDFNQMLDLPVASRSSRTVSQYDAQALSGRLIATGRHCFGCTAGAGSSCQGAITH